ncbi:hypothetical protein HYV86_00310 [Candidatus Woesearchaeota archaeon]|nr:hypothetical protein [Candidatus Woesearchaeota archaeon]
MERIAKALEWSPRVFSTSIVGLWMAGFIVLYGFGPHFFAGMLVTLILISTTLMAWRTDVFGGFLFIVESIIILLTGLGKSSEFVYVILALPLFLTGVLYVTNYFYQEHHQAIAEDDF